MWQTGRLGCFVIATELSCHHWGVKLTFVDLIPGGKDLDIGIVVNRYRNMGLSYNNRSRIFQEITFCARTLRSAGARKLVRWIIRTLEERTKVIKFTLP